MPGLTEPAIATPARSDSDASATSQVCLENWRPVDGESKTTTPTGCTATAITEPFLQVASVAQTSPRLVGSKENDQHMDRG